MNFFYQEFYITILLIFSIFLSTFILYLLLRLGVYNPDVEKLSICECDFDTYEDARNGFDVEFYLATITFIIFDLEAAFFFPWCVSFSFLTVDGLWGILDFIFELFFGLLIILIWNKSMLFDKMKIRFIFFQKKILEFVSYLTKKIIFFIIDLVIYLFFWGVLILIGGLWCMKKLHFNVDLLFDYMYAWVVDHINFISKIIYEFFYQEIFFILLIFGTFLFLFLLLRLDIYKSVFINNKY